MLKLIDVSRVVCNFDFCTLLSENVRRFNLYELFDLQLQVAALYMTWTLKYHTGHRVRLNAC